MDCIELIEVQKAMIGRGVDYETSELILNDFILRMKRFESEGEKFKNIFVFSIQDNVCGGLVFAKSVEDARKKLTEQRGVEMHEGHTLIYALSDIELLDSSHEDVIDLW